MKKLQPSFWVTNITNRNVSLADLALTIKAYTTVNLLDKRHYSYTIEQLLKSKESGSLFKKGYMIKVRDIPPPEKEKEQMPIQREAIMPSRERSILAIDVKEYDELKISEEDQKKQEEIYAQENADLAEIDIQRSISVKGQ